jgi:chromosome segregation and condensation protein ScpB
MTFRELVQGFDKCCQDFREYGACDSEPQSIVRALIRNALKGRQVNIPTTASGWELYSSMEDADIVAGLLAERAKPLVEMARQASKIAEYCDL